MNILPRVKRLIAPDFDMTNMQGINDRLHDFRLATRCGRQGQKPKMWILLHHESDYLAISWKDESVRFLRWHNFISKPDCHSTLPLSSDRK